MEQTKTPEKEVLVVNELPSQQLKEVLAEDGKTYTLLTVSEALTEILQNVRIIKKATA